MKTIFLFALLVALTHSAAYVDPHGEEMHDAMEDGDLELQAQADSKGLTDEFGKYFVNFSPDDLWVFEVNGTNTEILMENLTALEANVTGFYYTSVPEDKVDVRLTGHQRIIFALNIEGVPEPLQSNGTLQPVERELRNIDKRIEGAVAKGKFYFQRSKSNLEYKTINHNRLFVGAFIETIVIIGGVIWQVYYIKRLLDNRILI